MPARKNKLSDCGSVKRVLHVITSLELGGAQMMLLKILSASSQDSFRHEVLSLMDKGTLGEQFAERGIPVHELNMGRFPRLRDIYNLIKMVRRRKPDIVQGWMYHGNIAALVAWIFLSGKTALFWNVRTSVYRIEGEKKLTVWLIRLGAWISNMPDRILYNSYVSAQQHEALGYKKKKSLVIPNCFDVDRFVPSEEARLSVRSELGVPPSTLLIGMFCRYHPVKDHANFMAAAAGLTAVMKDVHFVLAGTGVDEGNGELTGMVKNYRLNGNVHLLGERGDMNRWLAGMDIVTSCSYGEGMSNVVGEAMACGVPCAVTDVGDNGLLVGDTGRLIPSGDSDALQNAWMELIEMGKEDRSGLGHAARERIMQHYMIDSVIPQYESLYKQAAVSS